VLGDAQAGDVSTEALQRVVTAVPGKSYRRDITRRCLRVGAGVAAMRETWADGATRRGNRF
jgi:hypothetical protein